MYLVSLEEEVGSHEPGHTGSLLRATVLVVVCHKGTHTSHVLEGGVMKYDALCFNLQIC